MSKKREVSIGSDPEIAYVDGRTGDVAPVCGLLGGEKGKPIVAGAFGGYLEDGVAIELNPAPGQARGIDSALVLATMHAERVTLCLDAVRKELRRQKAELHFPIHDAIFSEDKLTHPNSKVFGCAVDFDAYRPDVPRQGIMERAMERHGPGVRFYGGHVHLGVSDWPEDLPKFIAVRFIDLLLGFSYKRNISPRPTRRTEFYGTAGLYRETAYGVEYRTPCNQWMAELRTGTPTILTRMGEIGLLFARFEKYKNALVEIYNTIDWQRFSGALSAHDWHGVEGSLRGLPVVASARNGSHYLQINDAYFPIYGIKAAVVWSEADWAKYHVDGGARMFDPADMLRAPDMVNIRNEDPPDPIDLVEEENEDNDEEQQANGR
jgi:hypothetical protein